MAASHALRLATHGPTIAAAAVAAVATATVAADSPSPTIISYHPSPQFAFLNAGGKVSLVNSGSLLGKQTFLPERELQLPQCPVLGRAQWMQGFGIKSEHIQATVQPSNNPSSSLRVNSSKFASSSASSSAPPHLSVSVPTSTHTYHTWYVPPPAAETPVEGLSPLDPGKTPPAAVILLGWLGAKQKHLKRYAEWYNAQGIHAVTFVLPMASVLSVGAGGKAEAHVDALVAEVRRWLQDNGLGDKSLLFHTFSNTGWLTYGAVLERLHDGGKDIVDKIKGCVVDSAPVVEADPQVFAAGFSAAILKKRSSATQPGGGARAQAARLGAADIVGATEAVRENPGEAFLQSALEKFFSYFLQIPKVKSRLSEVTTVLTEKQPPSPQLYIYSRVDKVIPYTKVESFINMQRATGRKVLAKRFESSPHVDHFRSQPELYKSQLAQFLKEVLPNHQAPAPPDVAAA